MKMGKILSKICLPNHEEITDIDNTSTFLDKPIGNATTLQSNREFHSEGTSTYWLPKDDEEQDRLTGVSFFSSCVFPL
jgi:hypothetical protein